MNCPNCQGPLIAGEAFFKKSVTDLVAFGLGSDDLWMKSEQGDENLLLTTAEKAAVQFCRECGVAVIATGQGRRRAAHRAAT
jgi:hypothetical protein